MDLRRMHVPQRAQRILLRGLRPEENAEAKAGAARLDRVSADEGEGGAGAGPAFWQCGTCSYNNDASSSSCDMCNAPKPKGQARQKKIVSLWACPLCTRLVTSDRDECDVCTSDREAIRASADDDHKEATGDGVAALFGSSLISRGGVPFDAAALEGKCVALYFSASWCAPCRTFTPQLSSIYLGAAAAGFPFEVVFVSAASDGDAFNSYFASMPWRAVKYSDADARKRLNAQFDVSGIPTLLVLDAAGRVFTADGRGDIARMGDAAVPAWIAKSGAAPAGSSGGSDGGSGGSH